MAISLRTRVLLYAFPPENVHLNHSSSPTLHQAIKTRGYPQGTSLVHQQVPGLVFSVSLVYALVVCWQYPRFLSSIVWLGLGVGLLVAAYRRASVAQIASSPDIVPLGKSGGRKAHRTYQVRKARKARKDLGVRKINISLKCKEPVTSAVLPQLDPQSPVKMVHLIDER